MRLPELTGIFSVGPSAGHLVVLVYHPNQEVVVPSVLVFLRGGSEKAGWRFSRKTIPGCGTVYLWSGFSISTSSSSVHSGGGASRRGFLVVASRTRIAFSHANLLRTGIKVIIMLASTNGCFD